MKKVLSVFLIFLIVLSSLVGNIGFAVDPLNHVSNHKDQDDNNVHVFYCADDGNAMPTCVSIASVLENAGDEKINVHIVSFQDNKMSEENIKNIKALKNIKDFNFDFVYFDRKRLNEFDTSGWNKSIMIKLYCAELFPKLDRIIWLDDDVIVLKSLKGLYNLDISDKYLAAIDMYQESHNGDNRWINAGIGLYNLKEMRNDNIQKNLLDCAKEYAIRKNKITHACGGVEEFALTYGMPRNKVFTLPFKYGPLIGFCDVNSLPCKMSDIVAMHFANPRYKPWKNLSVFCTEKWWNYAIKTEFYDKVPKAVNIIFNKRKKILEIRDKQASKTLPDGIYTISSKLDPNKCLDIPSGSKNDEANLQLLQKNGANNQKFKIEYNSDGYYTIKAMCSGKPIDVAASGKKNGTNIWQYTSNGTDAQKWFIVPDEEGYYCLVSKCNNLCMDVDGGKTSDGANIHCWSIHGGASQRFKLEKCEDKPSSNKSAELKKSA